MMGEAVRPLSGYGRNGRLRFFRGRSGWFRCGGGGWRGGRLGGGLGRVTGTDEDPGGAAGWSIGNARYTKSSPSAAWVDNSSFGILRMTFKGALNDGAAPTLSTATVEGSSLVLTYNESLDEGSVPATSAYSVSINSGTGAAPSNVSIDGSAVTLTLATAAVNGDTVTVSYTVPSSNPVQDLAGDDAAALTDQSVTNNTPDPNRTLLDNHSGGIAATSLIVGDGEVGSNPYQAYFVAQKFRTGAGQGGYTLTSITLNAALFGDSGNTSARVSIYSADANGNPGSSVIVLTGSLSAGDVTFTAPANSTLNASTDYFVYLEDTDADSPYGYFTVKDSDATAFDSAQPGWSLGDRYNKIDDGEWETNASLRTAIEIKGTINDSTAPTLSTATVDGSSLVLTYNETLDSTSIPATSAFSVSLNSGTGAAPSNVSVVGTKVTLTLATAAVNTDTVTVTYTVPATHPVQDAAGNDAAALTSQAVTNNTAAVATNSAPSFTDGDMTTRNVPENSAADANVGAAVAATDSDNDTLTYSLTGTDSGSFTIDSTNGQIKTKSGVTYNYEDTSNNSYSVTVRVHDGKNSTGGTDTSIDDTITVTINLTDVNEEPAFNTGLSDTINVAENTATNTDIGSAYTATDPESDTLTYSLSDTTADSGDAAVFSITSSGQIKTSGSLDYETKTSYSVTVNVRDSKVNAASGNGNADTAVDASYNVTINVTNVNEDGTVTISGTLSGGSELTATLTDPDGSLSSQMYQWQRASSPCDSWSNIGSASTSNKYTLVATDVNKCIRVTASYTDGHGSGKSATSTATSAIGASNSKPTFDEGDNEVTRSVAENSLGTDVGSAVEASDSDSDTLTYSLAGTDAGSFDIVSTTGQIKTKATGVTYNFEAEKNTYNVTVRVHDGKDAAGDSDTSIDDTIPVKISLTNVNEDPDISTTTTTVNVAENTPATTTVVDFDATDPDADTTLTWSVESADDGARFAINSSTGVLTFQASPDFETPNQSGPTDNQYKVTVKVTDSVTPTAGTDTHTLTVNVTNVNEAPTFNTGLATTLSVAENTVASTDIGDAYTATDPDSGDTLTYTLSDTTAGSGDAGVFRINSSGQIQTHGSLDYETKTSYSVTVNVRDSKINTVGATNGNSDSAVDASHNVTINVTDLNETPVISGVAAPNFEEVSYTLASPSARNVTQFSATDDDDGDTITWDVSGTDAAHFEISSSGQLSFAAKSETNRIDFENPDDDNQDNLYEIVVEADDGQGIDAGHATEGASVGTYNVTVRVTNLDETPEITGNATPSFAEIEYDATSPSLVVATYTGRDEEGETITWSLSAPNNNNTEDRDHFSITTNDQGQGVLSFVARPNFEMPADDADHDGVDGDNVYKVRVQASDAVTSAGNRANTSLYTVTVTVTNVDERPEITNPPANVSNFPEIEYDFTGTPDLHVATFTARDEESEDLTWSLSGDDAGDFTIMENDEGEGVVVFSAEPNFEMHADTGSDGLYEFTVVATDEGTGAEARTGSHNFTVTVTDVNEQPELTGTVIEAKNYDENDTADVATWTARDEEGGVNWSLEGTDAADFSIDSGGTVTFNAVPNWEEPDDSGGNNVYEFTVVATDILSGGPPRLRATVGVEVTVQDLEEPGKIELDNLNPGVGDTIGFTISDPDGGIVLAFPHQDGFSWVVQGRTGGGAWQNIETQQTQTLDSGYLVDEDDDGKQLRVVVNPYRDRRGPNKSVVSEETAAVTPDPITNAPPRFTSAPDLAVDETGAGQNIGERLMATDRDNDTLTFGLSTDPVSAMFEIHSSSGQLRTAEELDFEETSGPLLVTVTLHDGHDADGNPSDAIDTTHTLAITVLDVEEEGAVTFSSDAPSVGTPLTATLEDDDGSISGQTWRWSRSSNGRTNWIPITGANSSSYTPQQYDSDFFLRARVTYTDNRGSGKDASAVTAQKVFGQNRAPTFPASETGQRTVAENTPAGRNIGDPVRAEDPDSDPLTYALSGADAGAFSINTGTGQLRTREPLDFETKPSYTVTVEVHDRKDGLGNPSTAIDAAREVTITVENVDEPGTVTLSSLTESIQARVEVTATLEDPDGVVGAVTWQWSRSSNRSSWFNVATGDTFTPTLEADAGNYIRATASYTDGHGSGKTAQAVSPRVGDPPPVNSKPAFPATEDGRRSVAEDASGGDPIGDPIVANDVNNDTLTYTLSGTDAGSFTVEANSGQLRLASDAELDFESKRSYRLTLQVSDGADQNDDPDDDAVDDTLSVTINVTDVNEAPEVTGDATVSFAENGNAAVATYRAADPERDTISWSVSNDTTFFITPAGQLYFITPPSFEDRTSYQVTVMAEDEEGLSDSLGVTVTVTDVEEEGTVTITPLRGWEGTAFAATLADDDGNTSGTNWQWARSTNRSTWTDIENATSNTYTAGADDVGHYLQATVSYSDRRGSNKEAAASIATRIGEGRPSTNNQPEFADETVSRSISQGTGAKRPIGRPVTATDPDPGDVLTYGLSGADADVFAIDPGTGQLRTKDVLVQEEQDTYTVTVEVHDGFDPGYNPNDGQDDSVEVIITVAGGSFGSGGGGGFGSFGGGGGGGATGPTPSEVDFEWNVKRDIEALDRGHDNPTGAWSDGTTIWIADSVQDKLFAYDLATGERVEDLEFALDERNRAPRGVWSDGTTIWVADSVRDKLFAYDLATGERKPEADVELDRANREPRGIWSDGTTLWVLNRNPSLFAYDLATGEFLASWALDGRNRDPRGLWSDGTTFWVSDPGASPRRLFAYRVPTLPAEGEALPEEPPALERVRDEEFEELSSASNNSPRGIWSDGDVVYVADARDARVYTYNVPDAIAERLAEFLLRVSSARTSELALEAGWNTFTWTGPDGAATADALQGDGDLANDISEAVAALFGWDAESGAWRVYFPGFRDVPGLNNLATLEQGGAYWIAVTEPVTWTILP